MGEGSSDVLVEECEVYDYHQNAFETVRTTSVVFRRNYSHSRAAADVPGGFVTEDTTRGDVGVLFEKTRFGLAENNVVESAATGVRVMGRSPGGRVGRAAADGVGSGDRQSPAGQPGAGTDGQRLSRRQPLPKPGTVQ
ncbi:MAG TPA: hypothetical protein VGL59_11295 [Polyangia bacterium]